MVNAKLDRISEQVKERLGFRLGQDAVVKAYDTNKDVYLTVTLGTGDNSVEAIIKFETYPANVQGSKDWLGLDQVVYTPHIAKVLFDSSIDGTTDTLVGTAPATKLAVLGEVLRLGMKVELYEVADVAIAIDDIKADNYVAKFESLEWGSLAGV